MLCVCSQSDADPDEHLASVSHAAAYSSVRALQQRLCGSFLDVCPSVDRSDAGGYCASDDAAAGDGPPIGGASLLDTRHTALAPILFHTRPRPLAAPAVELHDCSPAAAPRPRWHPAVARSENTTHADEDEGQAYGSGPGNPAAAGTRRGERQKKPPRQGAGNAAQGRLSSSLRRKIEKERVRMATTEPPVAGEDLVTQSFAVRLEPCTERHNFKFGPAVSAPEHGASSGLAMWSHVDGAELCHELYPHVRFQDGSLHHVYHENRLHEIVRGRFEAFPRRAQFDVRTRIGACRCSNRRPRCRRSRGRSETFFNPRRLPPLLRRGRCVPICRRSSCPACLA